jgi:hypothetical protein
MGRATFNEAEVTAQAWTRKVELDALNWKATRITSELEQAAGAASGWLADPRTAEPAWADVRARMLSALVACGAVAIGREG